MKLLRMKDVVDKTGLSQATLYRMIADEKFPRAIKIDNKHSRWVESEIDDWISDQIRLNREAG